MQEKLNTIIEIIVLSFMIWPPVKAWTSKVYIDRKLHFVAINYGGKLIEKWVILMSVTDSKVVVKVPCTQLADSSKWVPGWVDVKNIDSSLFNNVDTFEDLDFVSPSIDSGLTVPMTRGDTRPWF
tara:strand:+ start:57 stop:431 length:375 start_codon:yes stop_codon:yes gene_type:complete